MNSKRTSGEIRFENDSIVYALLAGDSRNLPPGSKSWTVPISAVRVIGEYTNSLGPFLDDYFLLFLTADETAWYCASFYASGMEKFMKELQMRLGNNVKFSLLNSTNFKSRVMWPQELEDHPLFESIPDPSGPNGISRILKKIFSSSSVRLTKEVQLAAGLNFN